MTAFRGVSFRYRSLFSLTVVFGLLALSGCGGKAEGDKFKGERGSVSGTVKYKGAPIPAGCSIMFQADVGYTGVGKTNDKGEYTLAYEGAAKLPAVAYKIQISLPVAAPKTMDPATVGKDAGAAAPAAAVIPAKYSSASSSGLTFTVKSGANKADFELTD